MNQKLLLGVILIVVIGFSAVGGYVFLSNDAEPADPEIPEEPENPETPEEPEAETQVITDMAGRNVTIPMNIDRVLALGSGMLRLLTFMEASDLIVAIEDPFAYPSSLSLVYEVAHPEYRELPTIGPMKTGDPELIAAQDLDIIFQSGTDAATLDALQEQVDVPVVGLNLGLFNNAEARQLYYNAVRFVGQVLHKEDRATELINFFNECVADLDSRTANIPDSEKLRVYVAGLTWRGTHGITSTAAHWGPFELTNANNVVTLELTNNVTTVVIMDAEILPELDPDLIFCHPSSLPLIKDDVANHMDIYGDLSAIQNNQTLLYWSEGYYNTQISLMLLDAYYVGMTIYPDQFADITLSEKGDEIFTSLYGQALFDQMEENVSELGWYFGFVNLLP